MTILVKFWLSRGSRGLTMVNNSACLGNVLRNMTFSRCERWTSVNTMWLCPFSMISVPWSCHEHVLRMSWEIHVLKAWIWSLMLMSWECLGKIMFSRPDYGQACSCLENVLRNKTFPRSGCLGAINTSLWEAFSRFSRLDYGQPWSCHENVLRIFMFSRSGW